MARHLWLLTILLVVTGWSVAWGRTWTDNQGRQISAKFIRVQGGVVVLQQGNKPVSIPLSRLSKADQEFIREELEKQGKLPPASMPAGPTPQPEAVTPIPVASPVRTWTDIDGNELTANLAGVAGENVVLVKDGRRLTFPLDHFVAADQEYIRKQLDFFLQQNRPPSALPSGPAGSGARSLDPGGQTSPPSVQPVEAHPSPVAAPRRPVAPVAVSSPTETDRSAPSFEPEEPAVDPPAPTPRKGMQGRMCCARCSKVVSTSVQAGDTCPNCGALWTYVEGKDGVRRNFLGFLADEAKLLGPWIALAIISACLYGLLRR
jgi:hypothetical protein